jgi:hypothetical protein
MARRYIYILGLLCAVLGSAGAAYNLKIVKNVVGSLTEIAPNPSVELQLGAYPGRQINMTLANITQLPALSCEYSSYCVQNNTVYTDYFYTPVHRGTLEYTLNTTLDEPRVRLQPDLWNPETQDLIFCPSQDGFLVDPNPNQAMRCFDRPLDNRVWQACAESPFECVFSTAVLNGIGGSTNYQTTLDATEAHIRIPHAISDNAVLVLGEMHISLGSAERVTLDSISRPLVIRENRTDIRVGIQSDGIAVWWKNDAVCVGSAWDKSETLQFTGLIIWAFLMYVLRTWMLWSKHTETVIDAEVKTGGVLLKLFHFIEIAGNVSAISIVYIHAFSVGLQERIFRISSIMTRPSSQWMLFLLLVIVSIQFFVWVLVRVEIVYRKTIVEYVIRRFCTVSNVLLSVCVLLIHNPMDHPTNLFLFGVGSALLFRRYIDIFSREMQGIHFVFLMLFFSQIIFVTGVCMPAFIDMMQPLNNETLITCVLVASMIVILPLLHQYHIGPKLTKYTL